MAAAAESNPLDTPRKQFPKTLDGVAIPQRMRAAVLHAYQGPSSLTIQMTDVPTPQPGEVLVKVEASPVNPHDLLLMDGMYGVRPPLPLVPGLECSGTVVASGGGFKAWLLVGKRVACAAGVRGGGGWAEYACFPVENVVKLPDDMSFETGACSLLNPLTALALMNIAKERGAKGIAISAGASQLGRMVTRLAVRQGIHVVHIVRGGEHVKILRKIGARNVLISGEVEFDSELTEMCKKMEVTLAFDFVGGIMTGRLLRAMPPYSRVLVSGGLSGESCSCLSTSDFIFERKIVEGFWLTHYLQDRNVLALLSLEKSAMDLARSDLQTDVKGCVSLMGLQEAIQGYTENMARGKVLITPPASWPLIDSSWDSTAPSLAVERATTTTTTTTTATATPSRTPPRTPPRTLPRTPPSAAATVTNVNIRGPIPPLALPGEE